MLQTVNVQNQTLHARSVAVFLPSNLLLTLKMKYILKKIIFSEKYSAGKLYCYTPAVSLAPNTISIG